LLRCVVWQKLTDVSKVLAASTIRAMIMMEAARTFETSETFYQATGRYNPDDSHLHRV
jgi:hypothetical protein